MDNISKPILPDPVLTELDDQTGLSSFQFMKMAPSIRYCDVVIVKASFAITAQGISPIAQAGEIIWADEFRDEANPLGSSLKAAGDLVLTKPGADIILTGNVHTDKAQTQFVSRVQLQDPQGQTMLANYACDICGPRYWQASLPGVWNQTQPEPTQAVPIEYELSYGGRQANPDKPEDEWQSWEENPSGSGYSRAHLRLIERERGIQWEPNSLIKGLKAKELTGFGPIARFWKSRQPLAGTYGKEWQAKLDAAVARKEHLQGPVIMDYAADFNPKFFQAAHPKLQTAQPLQGGEKLYLHNIIQGQASWQGQIPKLRMLARYESTQQGQASGPQKRWLNLDTVHIDTLAQSISLTWRISLPHGMGVKQLQLSGVNV